MKIRPDGSVASSNLPPRNPSKTEESSSIYRGQITKVLYSDDPKNPTSKTENPVVLYEILCLSGDSTGHTFSNARLMSDLGGEFNFSERVLRASIPGENFVAVSGPVETKLKEHSGDIVFFCFLGKKKHTPIIIGLEKPPKNKNEAAKKEDGPRKVEEFNGLRTEINKEGQVEIIQKGGEYKDINSGDYFEPNSDSVDFLNKFLLDKDGNLNLELGKDAPMKLNINPSDENLTLETTSGAILEIKGKSSIITLKVGSSELEINGNTGQISLRGDLVDIGSAASQLAVLGPVLISWLNSHTHLVTVTGGSSSGAYPSQPPMAPAPSNMLSNSVKLKD